MLALLVFDNLVICWLYWVICYAFDNFLEIGSQGLFSGDGMMRRSFVIFVFGDLFISGDLLLFIVIYVLNLNIVCF